MSRPTDSISFQPLSRSPTVALNRNYAVLTVDDAKTHAHEYMGAWLVRDALIFGLPEVDDRYHVWRVPLVAGKARRKIGEIVIDARSGVIDETRSSAEDVVTARLDQLPDVIAVGPRREAVTVSELPNMIICGDSEFALEFLPDESTDLVFTSPPYFNARPDYSDFVSYEEYLAKIQRVVRASHRVLHEGRFFVINVAPVLLRRARRSESSRRIAVPFDIHRLLIEEGFDFIDDIIWEKPEGAGWATGRGRRFAADRNPLQYKAVPVTEYVLVYRKRTSKLIDWHIRTHPDPSVVERSKIRGEYDRTNIWRIKPTSDRDHPAVFPRELAERVTRYYSFEGDVILDPFAGVGTVGEAAVRLKRRFVLSEMNTDYVDVIRQRAGRWLGREAERVKCIGCEPISAAERLF